jgi:hypothetical protein
MLVSSVCRECQHASPSVGGQFRSDFGAFPPLLSASSARGSRNLTPMYRSKLCAVRSRWVRFLGFLQGFREVGPRGARHSFGDCVRPVAAPFKENRNGPAQQCHSRRTDRLCKGLLTSYLDTYTRYLMERGYARRTINGDHACFPHFSRWVCHRRQAVRRVDKALVAEFIDEHLPRCNCAEPVRRNRLELRAVLSRLLYQTCPPKLCPAPRRPTSRTSPQKLQEPDPDEAELHIVRFCT